MGRPRLHLLDAIADKVLIGDGCWEWTANRKPAGYATRSYGGRSTLVHREMYEFFVGPIPDGLQLDHLCRNRACIRPDHLEPVTCRENLLRGDTIAAAMARKAECINGHPFDAGNTHMRPGGGRACNTCRRATVRRWRERQRSA